MFKKRRNLSKILLIFFIFSIVFSFALVALSVDHDCIGNECTICCEINLVKDIFCGMLIFPLLYTVFKAFIGLINYARYNCLFCCHLTPVELRVKILE